MVNGLAIPGQQKKLTAAVVPPPMEPLSGVLGYITPGTMRGRQGTMPRGPGFTSPEWTVDLTLDLEYPPTAPDLEQAFFLAVDAVLYALFAAQMPVFITDPTTGAKSQLNAIGEEYGFEPGHWVTTANGRLILFRGRISTTVRESFQTGAYASGGTVIP